MNQYLLLGINSISILILLGFTVFRPFKRGFGLKALAVYLFLACCSTLGYGGIKGGYDFKIDYNYMYGDNPLFSPSMSVFMVILRTLTSVVLVVAVMTPFYQNKYFKKLCQFVLPIITFLNIIFLDNNIIAMFGKNADYTIDYRGYGFIFMLLFFPFALSFKL